jgi:small-conductance mechanosensitive channel
MKEAECSAQFEINNLRNQLFLKENEISHILEEKNLLSDRVSSLTEELANEKEERGKRIEELISSTDVSRNEWDALRKSYEEKLRNR